MFGGDDMLKKGDVIYANFGSTQGNSSVQGGHRPCVIISDVVSEEHPVLIVSPITTEAKPFFPFIQPVTLQYPSYIHYEQIFTIPANHNAKVIYSLNSEELEEMMIRSSYCLGTHKANVLNIKDIASLLVMCGSITGKLIYECSPSLVFDLPLEKYEEKFGKYATEREVYDNLVTLTGLKLILSVV